MTRRDFGIGFVAMAISLGGPTVLHALVSFTVAWIGLHLLVPGEGRP